MGPQAKIQAGPKDRKGANISPCRIQMIVLLIVMQQKYFVFALKLNSPDHKPHWFGLYQCRAVNYWLIPL